MGKQVFAVCGKEESYIKKLYEYILKNYGEDFKVVLFTKEESFAAYLQESSVELVLAEEDFIVPKTEALLISLLSRPGKEGGIYKYMSSEQIMKEVMAVCANAKSIKGAIQCEENAKIIGIYTPIKRCFQTTFALTVGQILAKRHKVLYLNFEGYSGFEKLFHASGKSDLTDLVYFSETGKDSLSYRIESIKEKIGELDYINPIKIITKYKDISRDQWERLINNLSEHTDYEYILLDLSEQVNGLLYILQKCTRIYTIIDSERMASAKMVQYENLLRESNFEDVTGKTQNIVLPRFREIPQDYEMLPYSELADYVKKILCYDSEAEVIE